MRFLLPVGGIVDRRFGIMTTPGHKGVPVGIVAGMDWAADNQAFTKGFQPNIFFDWLKFMEPYRETCLFVPLPDVVGDAERTIRNFKMWAYKFTGWPRAFVAQDGQEDLDFPMVDRWSTLFVGGSREIADGRVVYEWKCSEAAVSVIKRAQALGKHIHIGRVNWQLRYSLFRGLEGSDEFTCDGTRTRYEGTDKTIDAWAQYQSEPYTLRLDLSSCDSPG